MAVDKFSVSMPEELVAALDGLAGEDGLTRSGVLREAAARYVTAREAERRETARRAGVESALEAFDAIAQAWGADGTSGNDYLSEIRGDEPVRGSDVTSDGRG